MFCKLNVSAIAVIILTIMGFMLLSGCTSSHQRAMKLSSQGYYNVHSFGTVGDGKHLDSPAINRAIATCNANGGRTRKDVPRDPQELNHGYPGPTHIGVMPSYGVFVRHARNIQLSNIKVSFKKADHRPAMVCKDVRGLQINHFEAQLVKGVTAAHFVAVTDLQIRNSPVLKNDARP